MTDVETRTYEIVTIDGTYQIEVPATARVSYGPAIGANGKASFGGGGGNCLRIWEGTKVNEVQRALFQNVTSFRDLSLAMRVRAVRKFGTEDWFRDDGTWIGDRLDQVERSWRLPDELATTPPPTEHDDWSTPTAIKRTPR